MGAGKTVAMMVWNTCENDSRVIKEATSLASAGYSVNVVCLKADHLPDVETRDGVTYRRVARMVGPVRDRVDSVVSVLSLVAVLLLAASAAFGVALFGRWLGGRGSAPAEVAVAMVVTLGLGVIIGRLKVRKVRHLIVRGVLRPIRMRVLWVLYRVLTFRLVYYAMGQTVLELRPDVVHAHDLQTLPAAVRLAEAAGAKLVYDSHELSLNVSNPPIKPLRWWMKGVERRAIRKAGFVTTVSQGIADILQSRYEVKRPIVIYNAPPTAGADETSRNVRDDLSLDPSVPLALYVGAPSFHRGLEVLVDALAILPEFHLALVGPRNEEWETELLARAGASAARMHFLDAVPIGELLGYLSSADVGVIAYQNICLNHEHCMPNKLFETTLAGVPLVVANLRDLRGFVEEHGVGRAADEKDPAAIARAIREVAADETLRPAGERLVRLREEFGWEAQGRRLVEAYRGLVPATAAMEGSAPSIAQ